MSDLNTPARKALEAYFQRDGAETKVSFSNELGISQGFLIDIIKGRKRPSYEIAKGIEHLTKGLIRLDDWVLVGSVRRIPSKAKAKTRAA